MLYPIELLGPMTVILPRGGATDGVHVNGRVGFCHVVCRLFECRPQLTGVAAVWSRGTWHLVPSCKMHYPKMPALQIAIKQPTKLHLSN